MVLLSDGLPIPQEENFSMSQERWIDSVMIVLDYSTRNNEAGWLQQINEIGKFCLASDANAYFIKSSLF
jgi:hypothetical protein